jgi:hypothetical protein
MTRAWDTMDHYTVLHRTINSLFVARQIEFRASRNACHCYAMRSYGAAARIFDLI